MKNAIRLAVLALVSTATLGAGSPALAVVPESEEDYGLAEVTAEYYRVESLPSEEGTEETLVTWGNVSSEPAPGNTIVLESPAEQAAQESRQSATSAGSDSMEAAGAATCSLLVSNVKYDSGRLQGTTVVTCTGAFGSMRSSGHLRRSSWLGYRDYTNWSNAPWTRSGQQQVTWAGTCDNGEGDHTYQVQAQAYASAVGLSPYGYSRVGNRFDCGT